MSPSPTESGGAGHGVWVAAVALAVVLVSAIFLVNNQMASDDTVDEAAPSDTPSSPPASTKTRAEEAASSKPIRVSDGSVQVDGHILTPAIRVSASDIDLRVFSPAYGRPWTGPWELDISRLKIDHTPTNVVFTLSFAELNIREGWRNDTFRIYVDSKENPPGPLAWPAQYPAAEREVDFSVVPNLMDGAVYRHRGDMPRPIGNCKFEASLHEAIDSVSVKAPRRCFDYPSQLRALAELQSPRYNGWEAWDRTEWTGFAALGGSAATRDPAREWRQAP
jgi:hypothetical protein